MNLISPRHPAARHTALSNPSQSPLSTKCTWTFQCPKPQSRPGSRLVQPAGQPYLSALQHIPSFAQDFSCLTLQLLSCKADLFSSAYSNSNNGQMVPDATLPVCPQSATQMLLHAQPAHSACCRSHKSHETLYVCLAAAHGTVLCAAYAMLSGHALVRPPIPRWKYDCCVHGSFCQGSLHLSCLLSIMTDEGILDRMIHAHNNHISTFCTHQSTALPATST